MRFDYHCHTKYSDCCDRAVTPREYLLKLPGTGLDGFGISDHQFQLYFPPPVAWSYEFYRYPKLIDKYRRKAERRLAEYMAEYRPYRSDGIPLGIEMEVLQDGRPLFPIEMLTDLDYIVGSIHFLPGMKDGAGAEELVAQFFEQLAGLLANPVAILAHPFRILEAQGIAIGTEMIGRALDLVERERTAVEINGHVATKSDAALLKEAVRRGIPVAFSTDSHALSEFGDFAYHEKVLLESGVAPSALRFYSHKIPIRD